LALPHPDTIRSWYSSIDGKPGFTCEAFLAVEKKVEQLSTSGKTLVVSLTFDEMSIRKQLEWDESTCHGFVDLGTDADMAEGLLATHALVFMLVALNDGWKIHCGYFFIDGLDGEERANLVRLCLDKCYDAGVQVGSITCDGPAPNFSMFQALGANLKGGSEMTSFLHKAGVDGTVQIILDSVTEKRRDGIDA